jgi:hypothetical protein
MLRRSLSIAKSGFATLCVTNTLGAGSRDPTTMNIRWMTRGAPAEGRTFTLSLRWDY